jgi:hypothetical protein
MPAEVPADTTDATHRHAERALLALRRPGARRLSGDAAQRAARKLSRRVRKLVHADGGAGRGFHVVHRRDLPRLRTARSGRANATQAAVQDLPFETLVYLLGSRYCDTDLLSEEAWRRFETTPPGWARVQAICDFVHSAVAFDYMEASATRTASETLAGGKGVCRDFAHLAIALCRCMNIPARYCTGYLSEFGEPEPHAPGRLRGLDGGLARRPLVGFRSAQQLKTHGTDPDRPRPGRRRCAADPDFRAEYPDAVRRLDLGRKTRPGRDGACVSELNR